MVKVSIIVPVYNVEKYLTKCLDSLVNQTLKDIEIIVVNDGTKDNSQKVIDEYAKEYKNIRPFIKENGGLSDARNYGIAKAKGEYIAFLDSDDYVDITMYEKMYNKAKQENFDMVVCDLNYIYPNKTVKAYSNLKKDTKNIKECMIKIYPAAWNKIFKRSLFDSAIEFKRNIWFEDVEFIYRMLPKVKNIGVIHEHFYQYVQREGSITNTINHKIYDYIDNWNGIIEYYKNNKIYEEYKKELEYSYVRYIYATFIKQASRYCYNDYIEAVNTAQENVKKKFPKYKKNKYFYKSSKGLYLLLFNKSIAKLLYKIKNYNKKAKK